MPAAYDPKNLFKQIIDGTIPSHRIFETKHALAILDAFPTVDGHALLLPKHPCADVMDMPADVAASVLKELPRLARLVKQATGADGVNIVQNSGKSAGQVVFHCHFHVIPRFDGDAKPVAFAAGRKAMLSGEEGAVMLGRMKEPYAQSISAIDDFLGAMRAGAVDSPAAGGAPKAAPAKKAAAAAAPKPAAKEKPAAAPKGAAPKAEAKGDNSKGGDAKPKEHSGVKKEKVKTAGPPAAAERSLDVSFADIRVGKIIDATAHPDSDKLFVETIDLGEPAPRQILSGLGHSMTLDQVKGAAVVCICNLKARKLAGIASDGMVLCASDAEKTKLAFVLPPVRPLVYTFATSAGPPPVHGTQFIPPTHPPTHDPPRRAASRVTVWRGRASRARQRRPSRWTRRRRGRPSSHTSPPTPPARRATRACPLPWRAAPAHRPSPTASSREHSERTRARALLALYAARPARCGA